MSVVFLTETTGSLRHPETRRTPSYIKTKEKKYIVRMTLLYEYNIYIYIYINIILIHQYSVIIVYAIDIVLIKREREGVKKEE